MTPEELAQIQQQMPAPEEMPPDMAAPADMAAAPQMVAPPEAEMPPEMAADPGAAMPPEAAVSPAEAMGAPPEMVMDPSMTTSEGNDPNAALNDLSPQEDISAMQAGVPAMPPEAGPAGQDLSLPSMWSTGGLGLPPVDAGPAPNAPAQAGPDARVQPVDNPDTYDQPRMASGPTLSGIGHLQDNGAAEGHDQLGDVPSVPPMEEELVSPMVQAGPVGAGAAPPEMQQKMAASQKSVDAFMDVQKSLKLKSAVGKVKGAITGDTRRASEALKHTESRAAATRSDAILKMHGTKNIMDTRRGDTTEALIQKVKSKHPEGTITRRDGSTMKFASTNTFWDETEKVAGFMSAMKGGLKSIKNVARNVVDPLPKGMTRFGQNRAALNAANTAEGALSAKLPGSGITGFGKDVKMDTARVANGNFSRAMGGNTKSMGRLSNAIMKKRPNSLIAKTASVDYFWDDTVKVAGLFEHPLDTTEQFARLSPEQQAAALYAADPGSRSRWGAASGLNATLLAPLAVPYGAISGVNSGRRAQMAAAESMLSGDTTPSQERRLADASHTGVYGGLGTALLSSPGMAIGTQMADNDRAMERMHLARENDKVASNSMWD